MQEFRVHREPAFLRTCRTKVRPSSFSELRTCQTRFRHGPFFNLRTCGTNVVLSFSEPACKGLEFGERRGPFSELGTCQTRVRLGPFSELRTCGTKVWPYPLTRVWHSPFSELLACQSSEFVEMKGFSPNSKPELYVVLSPNFGPAQPGLTGSNSEPRAKSQSWNFLICSKLRGCEVL